jgi:hypothetical protein
MSECCSGGAKSSSKKSGAKKSTKAAPKKSGAKKPNVFAAFVKKFAAEHKGQYTGKQLMQAAAKAYHKK